MATLIIYTTKTNATKDISHLIFHGLKDYENPIIIKNVKEVSAINLEDFQTIIIGAPMYMGYYPKKMREFIGKYLEILKKKSLFMFLVGIDPKLDVSKFLKQSFPQTFIKHLKMSIHVGGEVREENLTLFKRYVLKQVIKESKNIDASNIGFNKQNINRLITEVKASLEIEG